MKTKKEFENYFKNLVLPNIRSEYEWGRRIDYPARREAWNNTIDMLVRDEELPEKARDWSCPW